MRLHALEVTGFGPFSGTERVDFDELGADGLFLLHGPTGAGKTTILDAVAFGLYGTVPGSRQDGRRLRSDHAAAGTPTEVMLEATIGGRRLRIRRSPEYMRPKQRGTGETKEQARATLEWLDGAGENLSRIPDVSAAVTRLLGMSAEQFFQVVLLPQGEFARFLKSETKTRAQLLERLFDTGRFGDVEKWFAERRRAGAAALERGVQAVTVAVESLADAAGTLLHGDAEGGDAEGGAEAREDAGGRAEEGEAADSTDWADSTDGPDSDVPLRDADPAAWADGVVSRAQAEAAGAGDAVMGLREAAVDARAHAERERDRARAQQRRTEALAAVTVFDAGAEERARMREERDAARRAEPVGWADGARRAAQADHGAASAALAAARTAFASAGEEATAVVAAAESADGAQLDSAALTRCARAWDDELVRLDAAAEDETALAGLQTEHDSLTGAIAAADRRIEELEEQSAGLPAVIEEARAAVAEAERAEASVPALAAARDEAASVARAAAAVPAASAARETAAAAASGALGAVNTARAHALDLREARLRGMAAELAGELAAGEPCAVCGSVEHPRPAAAAGDPVTQQDEDEANAAVAAAASRHEAAQEELRAADTELALQRERAGGADAEEAERRLSEATAAHAAAARIADGRAEAATRLERELAREDALRRQLRELADERRDHGARAAAVTARIDDARARLEAAVGPGTGARERAAHLRGLRTLLGELIEAAGALGTAALALQKADTAVADAAREAGFADAASALAAVRSADRCAGIDAALAAEQEAVASARAVLAEPAVAAVEGTEPAEPAAASAAAAEADRVLEAAVRAQEQATGRAAAVEAQAQRVRYAVARLAPLREEHEWLASLTDVLIGDGENARRMSLRSYVLAARLEEVAVVASQRLRVMSGGRYEFVHSEATIKRERRGGLGLDILDANTGAVRPTSTLSGGETFMASLALALGLADVVSEESGGIQLETLFIDEGFGTLDAETLDIVMGVLDELRAGGRAVGIVSHVAEMRHRIPSRLHVLKGEAGSRLQVRSAADA